MRNLTLNSSSCKEINHPSRIEKAIFCSDDQKDLSILDSNLNVVMFREFKVLHEINLLSHIAVPSPTVEAFLFDSFRKELVCAFKSGEILTVDCESGIALCNSGYASGILAVQFSPDEEFLVVVSDDYQMIMMTSVTSELIRVNLLDSQFGEGEFINVGWGKKETQFHGSDGKQAAKQKIEDISVEQDKIDAKVQISWRGDGQMFAVSFLLNGERRMKIFDKDGMLQYTSEKQPGLESNIAWRPSGNIIATTQLLPNKYVVAFFEKNGLKHGEFTLPPDVKVEKLVWSFDSEILAVLCKDVIQLSHKVLLFTTSNYYWYLKQCIDFAENGSVADMFWDGSLNLANSKTLHVFLDSNKYVSYKWSWITEHSRGFDEFDQSVIGVIDGKKLLLTNFRQAVVPPPMAAFEIKEDEYINDIVFAPGNVLDYQIDSNSFFLITKRRITLYKMEDKFPLKYEAIGTINLSESDYPCKNYVWFWMKPLVMVSLCEENGEHFIKEFQLQKEYTISNIITTKISKGVINGCINPKNNEELFLQSAEGSLQAYNVGGKLMDLEYSFPVPCFTFEVAKVDNEIYFIGLSLKNRLYINGEEYSNNINSIFVHSHFLLLSSMQHKILITELTKSGLEYLKNQNANICEGVSVRNLERGGRLVMAVPCDTRTILQMPRGNLETIQPRSLALKIIGEMLDLCKYAKAFDLMRKQRINLNLFYDHNPEHFLTNISNFISEICNNSWLNLFIASLEDIDVTATMYSSSYVGRNGIECMGKVNKICKALQEVLTEESISKNKKLPLITTYLKEGRTEGIEKALSIVADIKNNGSKEIVNSDEALKYIFYMVDVNTVFDIALGMYDFDLVLNVASKSQKDPKEYIPMLNEFKDMEENYMKFSINKHLKRFERAVEFLAKCEPSRNDELRTFVRFHGLFKVALVSLDIDSEVFKQISEDYALHLKLNKHFYEAGVIYRRGGHRDKAIDCFKEVDCDLALKLASAYPIEKYNELCRELVERLSEEKEHEAVLSIYENHLKDIASCVEYAVSCGHYLTAIRLCDQMNTKVTAEKAILPSLQEDYENTKRTICSNEETFMKYRNRLLIVRENKSKIIENLEHDNYNKDCDLYSDAGSTVASNSSRTSSRTFRSSKNRRKHERKLISLKEGSQYEDVALISSLHSIVVSTFDLRRHVATVSKALSWFSLDKEAHSLQLTLDQALKMMPQYFGEIWAEEIKFDSENPLLATQHFKEVLHQLRQPPLIQDMKWKLDFL